MKSMHFSSGQNLIEVLLAVGLFAILMAAVVTSFTDIFRSEFFASNRTDGIRMAQEGLEGARAIRDRDFAELSAGTYGLILSGGEWAFSGTSDTRDIFNRSIEISEPDADIRYVTSTVSWNDGGQTRSIALNTTLTDWRQTISAGAEYDWANPSVASTIDLSLFLQTAISAAASGTTGFIGLSPEFFFLGTDEFQVVDASSSTYPSVIGSLDLASGANAIAISGDYAYVASDSDTDELIVIDISTPASPLQVTSFDLTGTGDGRDVTVDGNRLYLTRDDSGGNDVFYVYDISTPASPSLLGSANFGAGEYDVALSQSGPAFAFIASESTSQEFQAVNVTNPGSMGVSGSLDFSGTADALAVAVSGTIAYVGTENRGGDPEYYVVNISTPTSPSVINTGEAEKINVLHVANGYLYGGLDDDTIEFAVVDMSDPNTIVLTASLDLAGDVDDLAVTENLVFAATGDIAGEIVIIEAPAL